MRGLTPEERFALNEIANEVRYGLESRALAVRWDLVEQGRLRLGPGIPAPGTAHPPHSFYLTPAGREALRLYPLMLGVQEAA